MLNQATGSACPHCLPSARKRRGRHAQARVLARAVAAKSSTHAHARRTSPAGDRQAGTRRFRAFLLCALALAWAALLAMVRRLQAALNAAKRAASREFFEAETIRAGAAVGAESLQTEAPSTEYLPAAQLVHPEARLAPTVSENFPARHWTQLEASTEEEYVPARHLVHATLPATKQLAVKP
jgi:hypothetical protein